MSKYIAKLRRDYEHGELTKENLKDDPIALFKEWFSVAINADDILEPNVMVLATATKNGIPGARILLLKGVDERGFIFYSNYESRKGREIEQNPRGSMVFYWDRIERQVRIDGQLYKLSREESLQYFRSRPRQSQLGAWASPQSNPIKDRAFLDDRYTEIEKEYADQEVLDMPDNWGGYILKPEAIEFWQGRPNRLHDRFKYTRIGDNWQINRLAP